MLAAVGPDYTYRDFSTTTSVDYQAFYDYVSATQSLENRLASFEDPHSYHFKDLHYVKRFLKQRLRPIRRVLDVGCCGTPYPRLFDLDLKSTSHCLIDSVYRPR